MRWTAEMDELLREVVPGHHEHEAIALFFERTGIELTKNQLGARKTKLGLKGGVSKCQPRRFWTPEREAYFREIVPGRHEDEIRELFRERFGEELNHSRIQNAKHNFGVTSGTIGGRFEKGQASWNKGRPQAEWMRPESIERTKATRFKPGEVHGATGHVKPVGFERLDKDGYIQIKVKDTPQAQVPGRYNDNFRFKHHVVWEQANGRPVPEHTNIVFADGDRTNLDPANLVAVERRDWAPIRRAGCDYQDAEQLETRVNLVRLSRAINQAKKGLAE